MSQDELRAARVVFSLELSQCDAGEPYDLHAMQRAAIPLARAYLAVVADPTTLLAVKELVEALEAGRSDIGVIYTPRIRAALANLKYPY